MKFKSWIAAFRLKTLPLALSNTILGSCLAAAAGGFHWSVFALAASTTVLLQILSNMANDYGDFVNGKDTVERIGPKRMVQSGEISRQSMLKGIIVIGILCSISGVSLIWIGTQGIDFSNLLIFGILGIAAITAAIKYTVGKNPYGYRGLGDIFVFIFFGLVGVIGTYFMHTQTFHWDLLLPASALGFLSTGVLNMNNMRDYEADFNARKHTIVVAIGLKNATWYHFFLVVGALTFAVIFTLIHYQSLWQWLFIFSIPLFILNLKKVFTYQDAIQLYPELGRLSLATLIFTLTFGIGILL
jgi:1,4-dihydroxy-2-naphthoate octaprenyltransferase